MPSAPARATSQGRGAVRRTGRTFQYTTDGAGGTTWTAANTVANDTVLEQTQTVYDANSNPIETIYSQRFDNATGTGALGNPTTQPEARVYYSGMYYDLADRPIADINVGTNGGTAWVMPGSVPARSDTVLVSSYTYNAAGFNDTVTDPRGLVDQKSYDALGRVTQDIQDYTNGVPTNSSNQTVQYTYNGDNEMLTVTAVQPSGGNTPTQVTQYVYGVTTAGGSAVNSNDLLAATEYPDKSTGLPSSSQEVTYTYNALGQVATITDRNGNTHTYSYDGLGRQTSDSVTTLGSGVDGTVRRIDTAYDQQGNPYLFTSYADTTGLVVVNQVERLFNGLRQLTNEYQSLTGAVNSTLTPQVQYAYTEMSGGQNNSRLVSMTYPNGRVLSYNYNLGLDSSISRLSSISDNSATLESYIYLGLGTVVERDHPQTNVNQTFINQNGLTGDAGDKYTGLDRFGRIVEEAFINAITKSYTDDYLYTYDRDSNVLTKVNNLHTAFNETYTYNGLNELTGYTRANGDSQSYGLDAVGNMTNVNTNGTNQTRTQNAQNELTGVSGATTPVYDKNGNLTTDEAGQVYTYDAWNRLVKVVSGTNIVTYSFDALDRRITETTNAVTRDLFFDATNIIEERLAGNSNANIQYVWCPLCVNTLVLRDRDTLGLGTLNERLYYQTDANNNVTAVTDTTGAVDERYVFTPFGTVTVYTAGWSPLSGTQYANAYGFQQLRVDWVTQNLHALLRDYRPSIDVWTEMDPDGFGGGQMSLYGFVGDNPVGQRDPSGLAAPAPSPQDQFMAQLVDQSVARVEANPNFNPGNTGGFGTAVHQDVSAQLQGKKGWYTDVYVDRTTGEVKSIGGPPPGGVKGTDQIDALYTKGGKKLKVGDKLSAANCEDIYDVKTSLEGRIGRGQRARLRAHLNRGRKGRPRSVKALHSRRRWTKALGWHANPRFTQSIRLFSSALGAAGAIYAAVRSLDNEDDLTDIFNLIAKIRNTPAASRSNPDFAGDQAALLGKLNQYFQSFNPGEPSLASAFTYYKMLDVLAGQDPRNLTPLVNSPFPSNETYTVTNPNSAPSNYLLGPR